LNAPLDFSHENEQLFGDSDGRIVDLRFQRVRGATITLPEQTFSARSHHYDHHRSGQARLGADNASRIEMTILVTYRVMAFMAVIEQAGLPALRVAFTIAVIVFLFGGYVIFRKRHQFFDRDPNVENDFAVTRHNRLEAILFVWGGLTLVLISILYQVWTE
jgi:hypothetical protein